MSALIASALAAAALVAAPSTFQPEIRGASDESAPHALAMEARGPANLATSLGSEPFVAGVENTAPAPGPAPALAGNPVAHQPACITLATSLGSEPFLPGAEPAATPVFARKGGARDERAPELACR
jgi:hypothetical protein